MSDDVWEELDQDKEGTMNDVTPTSGASPLTQSGLVEVDPPTDVAEPYEMQVQSDVFWAKTHEKLSAPFPPELTHFRIGRTSGDRASVLAYIDARDVMDRLDEVLGNGNWVNAYTFLGSTTVCQLSIWDPHLERWISKQDGAGETKVEAEKGQLSDAFKRSAVHFGIGRYLYGLDSPWVDVEKKGRTAVIPERELDRLHQWLGQVLQGKRVGLPETKPPADAPTDPFADLEPEKEPAQQVADEQKPVDARKPSGGPINLKQAGLIMYRGIKHGEDIDMIGYEVIQHALSAEGLETVKGNPKGDDFKSALCLVVGRDDMDGLLAEIEKVPKGAF